MASNIYTQTLWQMAPTVSAGATPGPAVPVGYLWVIRDVALVAPGSADGFTATSSGSLEVNGIAIAATPATGTHTGFLFRWEELRQVVTVSDVWSFVSAAVGWKLRIGGYQLTAP